MLAIPARFSCYTGGLYGFSASRFLDSTGVQQVLILISGLILFLAPHLLRELRLRQAIIDSLPSEGAYKGLYSLTALAGLGLIIWGKSSSPFIMIWQPLYELRFISHVLMIPALSLVLAGNMPMSYMRKYLRNPMLLGVLFWSLSHLWSNGDLASILLFGSFALWSALKFTLLGLAAGTATKSASGFWDIIAVVGGLLLYVLISLYHGQLFGVGLNLV